MKTIEINIYEFDELGQQAKSKALTDYVYFNADKSAYAIMDEHGDKTATYLLAKEYLQKSSPTADIQDCFLKRLLKQYHQMLVHEYDYLSSDEAIIDAFNGNDQLFTADGQLDNRLEKLANDLQN